MQEETLEMTVLGEGKKDSLMMQGGRKGSFMCGGRILW